jgi:hypothetical protein
MVRRTRGQPLFGQRRRESGQLITEMIVAISILVLVMLPLAFAFAKEQKLCRTYYLEAVVMEIIDGEMEILAAGEWRSVGEGAQPYSIRARAAENLPPGKFILTRHGRGLKLEWAADKKGQGKRLVREVTVR